MALKKWANHKFYLKQSLYERTLHDIRLKAGPGRVGEDIYGIYVETDLNNHRAARREYVHEYTTLGQQLNYIKREQAALIVPIIISIASFLFSIFT